MPSPDINKNMCRFVHDEIHEIGINKVVHEHTHGDFNIENYESPG